MGDFTTEQQKFAEDVVKKAVRGALHDLDLFQKIEIPAQTDQFDIKGTYVVPQDATRVHINKHVLSDEKLSDD